jgi:1-deoxy-D-xylulose-5-phosphate reductoisomerase
LPAVLSAADEEAVSLFLRGAISFTAIAPLVESVMERHQSTTHPALDAILAADTWARVSAHELAPRFRRA